MKKYKSIFISFCCLTFLKSCDPVHSLHLDNQTGKPIKVIFKPMIDIGPIGSKIETITFNKTEYVQTILDSGKQMKIGKVVARYTPNFTDIELDYLETISGKDTIKLVGKKSIFNFLQKVENLDWRVIIK